jgi:hypothetical protein
MSQKGKIANEGDIRVLVQTLRFLGSNEVEKVAAEVTALCLYESS